MLLSCFGFIVIVRHSMQVYNYFLIKTWCVLCFCNWWLLVLTVGEDGRLSSPRVTTSVSCTFGTKRAVLAGRAPLGQDVLNVPFAMLCPIALARPWKCRRDPQKGDRCFSMSTCMWLSAEERTSDFPENMRSQVNWEASSPVSSCLPSTSSPPPTPSLQPLQSIPRLNPWT